MRSDSMKAGRGLVFVCNKGPQVFQEAWEYLLPSMRLPRLGRPMASPQESGNRRRGRGIQHIKTRVYAQIQCMQKFIKCSASLQLHCKWPCQATSFIRKSVHSRTSGRIKKAFVHINNSPPPSLAYYCFALSLMKEIRRLYTMLSLSSGLVMSCSEDTNCTSFELQSAPISFFIPLLLMNVRVSSRFSHSA